MQQLEAVRELSGRTSFRLFGCNDEPSLRSPQDRRAAGAARHRARAPAAGAALARVDGPGRSGDLCRQ
ncbi:hypothetical protein [Mesorhizobium sp. M1B.F.Ca.ET.045.04.1.1]|uniref:hypothetical protein n=1 Tax=Mesorhizobium sp. M1B.F.Ca.ET.045.04.1.1 TaxID=2493673 RepID=UPI002478F10D|nr:hypothetical protein [Mesorhizobium sp. M1B.F.Ca.ET.045.04.1.1]